MGAAKRKQRWRSKPKSRNRVVPGDRRTADRDLRPVSGHPSAEEGQVEGKAEALPIEGHALSNPQALSPTPPAPLPLETRFHEDIRF